MTACDVARIGPCTKMLIDLKLPAAPAQNDIMKAQLAACGAVGVLASEEEDGALVLGDGRQA